MTKSIRPLHAVIQGSIILFLTGLIWGCNGDIPPVDTAEGQVYATVNREQLTESDLRALVPSGFYDRLTAEHKANIVDEWIQKELLYQEALGEGIDREPQIQHLLENTKRELLSNELLERQLANIPEPSESELKDFYDRNKDLFILESAEYLVKYALFDTKEDVNNFHRLVRRDENFSDLARKSSKDPSSQDGGNLGIVNEDLVEPSVWEAIIATRTKYGLHSISDPFTVLDGWACIIIDEMYEAGTIKPYEHVKDLVSDMYSAEKRETAKQELINQLSGKSDIDRFLSPQSH